MKHQHAILRVHLPVTQSNGMQRNATGRFHFRTEYEAQKTLRHLESFGAWGAVVKVAEPEFATFDQVEKWRKDETRKISST